MQNANDDDTGLTAEWILEISKLQATVPVTYLLNMHIRINSRCLYTHQEDTPARCQPRTPPRQFMTFLMFN